MDEKLLGELTADVANLKKQVEDHEERMREQEEVKSVVNGLVETTKNLKETSEVLVNTMNDMKVAAAKTEGIVNIIKNIKLKDVIYVLVALVLVVSMITGNKVDSSTLKQLDTIASKIEACEDIEEVVEDVADSTEITND